MLDILILMAMAPLAAIGVAITVDIIKEIFSPKR